MQSSNAENLTCPIGLSLDVIGQKWSLLIIRECVRGSSRFSDFETVLGCPKNLLADRLRKLCDEGILFSEMHQIAGQRARNRYVLTPAGIELAPMLVALYDWGERHRANSTMVLPEPTKCACGATVHAVLQCEVGHVRQAGELVGQPATSASGEVTG